MNTSDPSHQRLQAFAEAVKAKTEAPVQGQPEEQLRAPFENFVVGEVSPDRPLDRTVSSRTTARLRN